MSKVQVDTIDTRSGTSTMQIGSTNTSTINIGVSGDTVNIPSGVTIANAGTATGFGGDNTPAFSAYLAFNSTQNISDATLTKVNLNTEHFDTDSTFDTSTYRFTCPSGGAGKYLFSWQIYLYGANIASNIQYANAVLYKNGSAYNGTDQDCRDNEQRTLVLGNSVLLDVADADYFELYGQLKVNSGTPSFYGGNRMTYLSAMRLIT